MKTHIKNMNIVLAILLTGCGVKTEDELNQAKRDPQAGRDEVSSLKAEIAEANSKVSKLTSELKAANEKVGELAFEVDRLKHEDKHVFAEAGKLLDAGDLSGARKAYEAFVRDFPSSWELSSAYRRIEQIERQQRAIQRERQDQASNRTAYQWWPILKGKTMWEIKALLGTPNHTMDDDNKWSYYDMAVAPNSGKKEWLDIYFRGGLVRGVGSQSLNSSDSGVRRFSMPQALKDLFANPWFYTISLIIGYLSYKVLPILIQN